MGFEGIWFCFFRSLVAEKGGDQARELGLQRNDSYWIFTNRNTYCLEAERRWMHGLMCLGGWIEPAASSIGVPSVWGGYGRGSGLTPSLRVT